MIRHLNQSHFDIELLNFLMSLLLQMIHFSFEHDSASNRYNFPFIVPFRAATQSFHSVRDWPFIGVQAMIEFFVFKVIVARPSRSVDFPFRATVVDDRLGNPSENVIPFVILHRLKHFFAQIFVLYLVPIPILWDGPLVRNFTVAYVPTIRVMGARYDQKLANITILDVDTSCWNRG